MIEQKYFQPPDKARVLLGFKVPATLRESLDALVKLWQLRQRLEKSRSIAKDEPKRAKMIQAAVDEIDLTYVCNRLLAVGLDGAWGQLLDAAGLERVPATEEEWEQLERHMVEETDRPSRPTSKR